MSLEIKRLHLAGLRGPDGRDWPVHGFVVTHPGGAVLVDTGVGGPQQVLDDWRVVNRSVADALAELDMTPGDIGLVINTHLHFDHAGNNDLLKDATFFVQREHYELAKGNPAFPNQYWNLPHLSYELVDGGTTLFPGVEVIPTPGHAPAHQSVLLRLPETGNIMLCGDAVYCQENYDYDAWDGQADPGTARTSALALRERAQRESASMIYGHDRNQVPSLRLSTDSYR